MSDSLHSFKYRHTSYLENGKGMSGSGSQSKTGSKEGVEAKEISDNKKVRLRKSLLLLSSDIPGQVKDIWNDLDDDEQREKTVIKSLENEIDELKKENMGLLEQIQQLELKVVPTDQHNKHRLDQLEKSQEYEKRIREDAEKKYKDDKVTNGELLQSYKDKLKKLQQEMEKQKKKTEVAENETKKAKEVLVRREEDDASYKSRYKHYDSIENQLQRTQEALKKKEDELEDYRTRLSRQMGDKLTDSNPNVADLSDQNRPTKLAERYQEIYDNEWSDAYENLDSYQNSEEETIATLMSILQESRTFCDEEAEKQMQELQNALTQNSSSEIYRLERQEIPTSVKKQMKDCRKILAEYSGERVYQKYLEKLRSSRSLTSKAQHVPKFLEACVKICWLMAVQDPPVVFSPNIKSVIDFNTDVYKTYTKSGKKLMFVVWPALHLHKDGPLLCKGIAQGGGSQRSTSAPPERRKEQPYDTRPVSSTSTISRATVSDVDSYMKGLTSSKGLVSRDKGDDKSSVERRTYTGLDGSYCFRHGSINVGYKSETQSYDTGKYIDKANHRFEESDTEDYEPDYDFGSPDYGIDGDYKTGSHNHRSEVWDSGLSLYNHTSGTNYYSSGTSRIQSNYSNYGTNTPNYLSGTSNYGSQTRKNTYDTGNYYSGSKDYLRRSRNSYEQKVIKRHSQPAFKEVHLQPWR